MIDTLTQLLATTHLAGDVFSHSLCDPPWGMRYPAAGHVWFHVVATGSCQLVADGERPRALTTHDLVLLPYGTGHLLCDAPDSRAIDVDPAWVRQQTRWPIVVTTGRGRRTRGPRSEIMCGSFSGAHSVLRLLPRVIFISGQQVMSHVGMQSTMQQLYRELAQHDVGAGSIIKRLLEVMFVQILRHWLDTVPAGSAGWLGALRDESIGNALGLMHADPARTWTIRTLAREVGMSRPVFARRFAEQVGDTPMEYLRAVRIDRAAEMLARTSDSIAEIANAVGYTSEYAFNRAFARERGVPPGRFRKTTDPR